MFSFRYIAFFRASLKNEGYIGEFEHVTDNLGGKFKIQLLAKITKCGAITPRFKVKKDEYNTWEQQFLPAYNRGILLVTTNQGVMSHKEAVNKNIGGFLGIYEYNNIKLVASTDGVGTKLELCKKTNQYDTIGIDLVAMCVNDIICQGAKPLFFLDYIQNSKIISFK